MSVLRESKCQIIPASDLSGLLTVIKQGLLRLIACYISQLSIQVFSGMTYKNTKRGIQLLLWHSAEQPADMVQYSAETKSGLKMLKQLDIFSFNSHVQHLQVSNDRKCQLFSFSCCRRILFSALFILS